MIKQIQDPLTVVVADGTLIVRTQSKPGSHSLLLCDRDDRPNRPKVVITLLSVESANSFLTATTLLRDRLIIEATTANVLNQLDDSAKTAPQFSPATADSQNGASPVAGASPVGASVLSPEQRDKVLDDLIRDAFRASEGSFADAVSQVRKSHPHLFTDTVELARKSPSMPAPTSSNPADSDDAAIQHFGIYTRRLFNSVVMLKDDYVVELRTDGAYHFRLPTTVEIGKPVREAEGHAVYRNWETASDLLAAFVNGHAHPTGSARVFTENPQLGWNNHSHPIWRFTHGYRALEAANRSGHTVRYCPPPMAASDHFARFACCRMALLSAGVPQHELPNYNPKH